MRIINKVLLLLLLLLLICKPELAVETMTSFVPWLANFEQEISLFRM